MILTRIEHTSQLLRTLLTEDPLYRQRWRDQSHRSKNALNQAAVARVIEQHLWEIGIVSDTNVEFARSLKDRVSRALTGRALSPETLRWFIEAFDMTQGVQDRLWAKFAGEETPKSEISHTLLSHREMIERQHHRTINLIEQYTVNPADTLSARNTIHTIRAIENSVDMYIYNHEPQAAKVAMVHGGSIGREFHYGGGLRSVGIMLDKPLMKDEETLMHYVTTFDERASGLQEVRRAAYARVEHVYMTVEFSGRPPKSCWWCVWADHLTGGPVSEEAIEIDGHLLSRFVHSIEDTVVGFRWIW